MSSFSCRVSRGTAEIRKEEIRRQLSQAYATYANANPLRASHSPPLCIDVLESDEPYTSHGKIRAVFWGPDGGLSRWWQDALHALMDELQNLFPERGIAVIHDGEGSALKRQPRKKTAAA